MKIAVLGTGDVGGTLGSRDPRSDKVRELLAAAGPNAKAAGNAEAVASADVVVLATPWDAARQVVESIKNWTGKILVDCTNPLTPDLHLALGTTTSAAEQIAGWARGARVVKAFNTTGYNNMADPIYHGTPITMFIGGDDAEAKKVVTRLAEDLGFEVVDAGGLVTARYLEPLAMLWIHLAAVQRLGRDFAFKLVRR